MLGQKKPHHLPPPPTPGPQRVPVNSVERVSVYRTDWTIMAMAAAVSVAGVLAVVPLYTV